MKNIKPFLLFSIVLISVFICVSAAGVIILDDNMSLARPSQGFPHAVPNNQFKVLISDKINPVEKIKKTLNEISNLKIYEEKKVLLDPFLEEYRDDLLNPKFFQEMDGPCSLFEFLFQHYNLLPRLVDEIYEKNKEYFHSLYAKEPFLARYLQLVDTHKIYTGDITHLAVCFFFIKNKISLDLPFDGHYPLQISTYRYSTLIKAMIDAGADKSHLNKDYNIDDDYPIVRVMEGGGSVFKGLPLQGEIGKVRNDEEYRALFVSASTLLDGLPQDYSSIILQFAHYRVLYYSFIKMGDDYGWILNKGLALYLDEYKGVTVYSKLQDAGSTHPLESNPSSYYLMFNEDFELDKNINVFEYSGFFSDIKDMNNDGNKEFIFGYHDRRLFYNVKNGQFQEIANIQYHTMAISYSISWLDEDGDGFMETITAGDPSLESRNSEEVTFFYRYKWDGEYYKEQ